MGPDAEVQLCHEGFCASRRAGFVCFTARTAIPSKTVCVKWCDPLTRTAGVGAAAASREEEC